MLVIYSLMEVWNIGNNMKIIITVYISIDDFNGWYITAIAFKDKDFEIPPFSVEGYFT